MKKTAFIILFPILIPLIIQTGCSPVEPADEFNFHMVEFSNISAVFNLSRTNILFGSYVNDAGESAIMAADGDLLFLMFEDESMFMRYKKSYGKNIDLSIDTVAKQRFYDQDDLVALNLTEDSLLLEWIDSVDGQTFSKLRTLQVILPLPESSRSLLQKISEHCIGVGLVLEGDGEAYNPDLEALHAFSPEWVYLTDYLIDIQDERSIPMFKKVELLGIEGGNIQWPLAPDILPNLESLILKEWDPLETGNYSLPNSTFLQSLTLVESNLTNLSFLEQLPELNSLHVVFCDTLSDIHYLNEITSLKSLAFPYCENISDINTMNHLNSLKWISYPTNIKPEELSRITSYFPNLQVVELIGCKEITDLTPVGNIDSLKCLIIDLPGMDLTPLSALSNLQLLVLEENKFEESAEEISRIQEAIPGLKVLPGGGLCLGSGWILIIFPMICVVWIFHHKKRLNKLINK